MEGKRSLVKIRPELLEMIGLYGEVRLKDRDESINDILELGSLAVAILMVDEGEVSAGRVAELLQMHVSEFMDNARIAHRRLGASGEQVRFALAHLKKDGPEPVYMPNKQNS
ncbi:MAG: hypothetical protein ACE5Q6_00835 [Dehalococcoidia bacterium]